MKTQLTLAFALLLICTGAALAQTPDHLPPALETVCDMEMGAAYGHCNAYCEAMDCELANDSDPLTEPSASATACSKVRFKFEQTTGRDLPCEVSCPCNGPMFPAFFAFVSGSISVNTCFTEPILGGTDGVVAVDSSFSVYGFSLEGGEAGWFCGTNSTSSIPISPAQGQLCVQLLEQAANRDGVTCVPPGGGR